MNKNSVKNSLKPFQKNNKTEIKLRKAKIDDSKNIWAWRNDSLTRAMSINKNYVEYEDHSDWFKSKLKNKNCFFYIGEIQQKKIGVVRIETKNNVGQVSINLNPKFRGMSLSANLLNESINKFKEKFNNYHLVAQIDKKNQASLRIFSKLGFKIKTCAKKYNIYELCNDK